jgi:hypothetical protein
LEVILLSSPPLDDQTAEDRFEQLIGEVVIPEK